MAKDTVGVAVGRSHLDVGNPEKVLFDDPGVTKLELTTYYKNVAAAMLPHLRGKPVAMERFPDGIGADGFIQKKVPADAPDWLDRIDVPRESGGTVTMPRCENAAALVYLADQAVVTFHPLLTSADNLRVPDRMIFDLDPPDDDFTVVRRAALLLRELLDELDLPAFPMTTGSRGMHVVVPLQRSDDIDDVRDFARQVADTLAHRHPDELTTQVRKQKRAGRLFVDVLRNAYAQHAVAPYSVRPFPDAPVATPLTWPEVDDNRLSAQRWGLRDIEDRLADAGDPWHGMRRRARTLRRARTQLSATQAPGSSMADIAAGEEG